jgi:hypothetical protein
LSGLFYSLAYDFHSIIYGLDVEKFQNNFTKWGPSARTCLGLGFKIMGENELKYKARWAAKKFVEDLIAGATVEGNPEVGSHTLFTTIPANPERSISALRVATPHLYDIIKSEVANISTAKQALFYTQASTHLFFRDA